MGSLDRVRMLSGEDFARFDIIKINLAGHIVAQNGSYIE